MSKMVRYVYAVNAKTHTTKAQQMRKQCIHCVHWCNVKGPEI